MFILFWALSIYLLNFVCEGNAQEGFVISFQSTGNISLDEWSEYKDDIPAISQFTACHWEYVRIFSRRTNALWSYCSTNDSIDITCTQYSYKRDLETGNRHITSRLRLNGKKENVNVRPFPHRSWNHVCWTRGRSGGGGGINIIFIY